MTLNQYKEKYESELESDWNDSGRFKFVNYDAFCLAMYNARKVD